MAYGPDPDYEVIGRYKKKPATNARTDTRAYGVRLAAPIKRRLSSAKKTPTRKTSGRSGSVLPTVSAGPARQSSPVASSVANQNNDNKNQGMSDLDYAMALINAQFGPQESQLNRGLKAQEYYGQTGDDRLQNIYAHLNQQLEGLQGRTKDLYTGAEGKLNELFNQVGQRQQTAGNDAMTALASQAQALGQGAGGAAASNPIAQLMTQFQGQNEAARGASVSNMQTLGTEMQGVGLNALRDASREGAMRRSDFIGEVGANTSDLLAQLQELAGQKGNALRTTLEDVKNARTDRERQAKLDALAEEIQRGTLDIQRQQLGMDRESHSLELQMKQMELEQAKAATQDPLERAKLQAEIDKLYAETDKIYAGMNAPGDAPKYKGQSGLEQWMSSPTSYWSSAGPRFREGVSSLLSQAQVESAKTGVDPYTLAVQAIQNMAGQTGLNPDALRTGLNIFFGKY